ncbi:hypothetical protein [Nitrosomonas sp. Nm166]|uniref:hypothetical protein n=1 Tax=Nitrosomonas sp. Nm166 TaxID=1881054 RepID=UPI0008DF0E6D|nr:hypothetical protein [Nitrosomonas sp. Nm166]SFE49382.1 hypothetical protein SAMN05428977_101825 [Nitrosomonas sp. Nm166]
MRKVGIDVAAVGLGSLQLDSTATTVRVRDGKINITDRLFTETKNLLHYDQRHVEGQSHRMEQALS